MPARLRFFIGAAVVVGWIQSARAEELPGFKQVFNGKDLSGWNGNTELWKVVDGAIVAESPSQKRNEFLVTDKSYRDFVFKATFRLKDGYGNSGIQFRSVRKPNDTEMIGYQADIGAGYTGSLYDESRRKKFLAEASKPLIAQTEKPNDTEMIGYQADIGAPNWWGCLYDESRRNRVLQGPRGDTPANRNLTKVLKPDGWNDYTIRAMDDRITLSINGALTVADYRERDANIARDGHFGLQIHADPKPQRVEFKNIYVQELPVAEPTSPGKTGFLSHEFESDGKKSRYVVYLPNGYHESPQKKWPGILFLHGAGERGDDGSLPIKVGIGPAILSRPNFPFVVVFAQAEKTWEGGSDDAKRALAVFNDACRKYNVDPDQRHITGISMGGRGTWDAVQAWPEEFASATVVCGFGTAEGAAKVAKLPIQLFCGDKDSERIVGSMNAIEKALKDSNAPMKATWYAGVGHNSWDAAYNTDSLYDWMLAQRRGKN